MIINFLKKISKSGGETQVVVDKATREAISAAYKRREGDLNSLREYDRGEKEINAPDIRDIVQSV